MFWLAQRACAEAINGCTTLSRQRYFKCRIFLPQSPLQSRKGSTWQRLEALPSPRPCQIFHRSDPLKLPVGSIPTHATSSWLTQQDSKSNSTLSVSHLRQYGETLHLPMELTIPGTDTFHRSEAAPLSLFLDAWEADEAAPRSEPVTSSSSPSTSPRIYIAQSPLSLLPPALAAAFPTPPVLSSSSTGATSSSEAEVYASSLWLGRAPTSTPLHRDPNPNLFVQVGGRKVIRLMDPEAGSALYHRLRREHGESGAGFGADERIRGEEMMKGREKELLERSIWGESDAGDGQETATAGASLALSGIEAELEPGEALYIPLGWWHAVRGVGEGVNLSVNWWFRPRGR